MNYLKLVVLFVLLAFTGSAQYTASKHNLRTYSPNNFRIRLLNNEGQKVKESNNKSLILNEGFSDGQKLEFSGAKYLTIQVGEEMGNCMVYLPREKGGIDIPPINTVSDKFLEFKGEQKIQIKKPTVDELFQYKNLAFNPYDWQGNEISLFPHAESNSECRNDYRFAARNVINGQTKNDAHSKWEDRSWGPEQIENPRLDIDFGRLVNIDKVVIYIRADFPHDGNWQSATITFDDGTKENIKLAKTAKAQVFTFSPRDIKSLKIENLTQPEPLQWCALSEVEVWGTEAFPFTIEETWEKTLRSFHWSEGMQKDNSFYWQILREKFPVESDWLMQDTDGDLVAFVKSLSETEGWKTITQKAILQISDKNIQAEFLERNDNTEY